MELNEIVLTVIPNPFQQRSDKYTLPRMPFDYLVRQNVDQKYARSQIIVWDLDTRIPEDKWDELPKSNSVIIKVIPSGTSQAERQRSGGKINIASALLVVGGLLTLPFGGGVIGLAVAGAGTVGLLVGTSMLLSVDDKEKNNKSRKDLGLRGSKNSINLGGRVPILVGRHKIAPVFGANPYTQAVTDQDNVRIHELFVAGYKNVKVEPESVSFKDTPVDNIQPPGVGATSPVIPKLIHSYSLSGYGGYSRHFYVVNSCNVTHKFNSVGSAGGMGLQYATGKITPAGWDVASKSVATSVSNRAEKLELSWLSGRTYVLSMGSGSSSSFMSAEMGISLFVGALPENSYIEEWNGFTWVPVTPIDS